MFLAGLVIAQFASGLAAQASASRLLFAMGRDGSLPRKVFAAINSKFHTPAFSVMFVGVVGLLAMLLDVTTSTSFINFGAFVAFTLVNVSVVVYYFRRRAAGENNNVWLYVVAPAIGAVITAYLLTQLDNRAIVLGLCWLAIGAVVLAVTSRGFKELPPEIAIDEIETTPTRAT